MAASRVLWEEIREREPGPETYLVFGDLCADSWKFSDRSCFAECTYHDLPPEPDLVLVAQHGLALTEDKRGRWLELTDLDPDAWKLRSRRNRRLVRKVKVRYLTEPATATPPPSDAPSLHKF